MSTYLGRWSKIVKIDLKLTLNGFFGLFHDECFSSGMQGWVLLPINKIVTLSTLRSLNVNSDRWSKIVKKGLKLTLNGFFGLFHEECFAGWM